ncbi:MAG: V-type ATPase subunit [Myxococcota bacterium]
MPGIEYVVSRVRGWRGHLLGPRGVMDLVAQPDLAARLELLRASGYGDALVGAATVREVGRALFRVHAHDVLRTHRLLEGRRQRVFGALMAFRDVWNLKTILRAVGRGQPAAGFHLLLVPTPELDVAALHELARQGEVKAVLDLLTTWHSPYAAPLRDAFPAYRHSGATLPLELALDRFCFARAVAETLRAGEDGAILLSFVRLQVDLVNAVTLLQLDEEAAAREAFLPDGLTLDARRFQRLAAMPAQERGHALARDPNLRLGPALVDGRVDPVRLGRYVQARLRAFLRRAARLHPLSLAVPLHFLLEREEEVRRIRLVLEGTELGLPAEELAELATREE